MSGKVIVTGMILSAAAQGDVDKRVTILTKENGKITAFAKGAKKATSSLQAQMSPFVFGEFELYIGRNSYSIVKVNVKNYFAEIRNDLENIYYGSYFLELADYYTKENNDEVEVLKLLYQSVKALVQTDISKKLIKCIYDYKMLVINGEYPQVFSCQICGENSNISGFSYINNGVVCSECSASVNDYFNLQPASIYALQFITSTPVTKLFTFSLIDEALIDLIKITEHYINISVDKKLKTKDFLDTL